MDMLQFHGDVIQQFAFADDGQQDANATDGAYAGGERNEGEIQALFNG